MQAIGQEFDPPILHQTNDKILKEQAMLDLYLFTVFVCFMFLAYVTYDLVSSGVLSRPSDCPDSVWKTALLLFPIVYALIPIYNVVYCAEVIQEMYF